MPKATKFTKIEVDDLKVGGNNIVNLFDLDTNTPAGSPLNGVYRIRHGFRNFLSNSSFEDWSSGTNQAPDNWISQGDVTVARSNTATHGNYSTQLTFGTGNTGELYQAIPSHTMVDYTFSCYVQRLSGTGNARLVAQENGGSYPEFKSVQLPTGSGWQLVLLTAKPSSGSTLRFNIRSADGVASVWLVDECMFEESKGIATTWQPNFDDTKDRIATTTTAPTFSAPDGYQIIDTVTHRLYVRSGGVWKYIQLV